MWKSVPRAFSNMIKDFVLGNMRTGPVVQTAVMSQGQNGMRSSVVRQELLQGLGFPDAQRAAFEQDWKHPRSHMLRESREVAQKAPAGCACVEKVWNV